MSRSTSMVVVVGALLGGVLVAVLLGGLGSRTETGFAPPGSVASTPAPGTQGAWVMTRSEVTSRSFLGLLPGDSTFTVTLSVPVTQACADLAGFGGRWPSAEPACASDVAAGDAAEGEIIGLSYSPAGVPAIVVSVDVAELCHEAATPGTAWPPDSAGCP